MNLIELHSLADSLQALQDHLNRNGAKPRFLAVLSPT
jgi:hypothetical protein